MNWLIPGLLAGLAGGLAVAAFIGAAAKRRLRSEADRADKAEAAARNAARLAEVGTLTGVLAHEIKNPLSIVGLNLQLLKEDLQALEGDHSRLENRLTTVQRETLRLREILDDFLRYAGKLELDRRPTDINKLLEELVDFFAPQAQAQRVQLRLKTNAQNTPLVCNIDPDAMKQAVLNLMINAVQATAAAGGGELILSSSLADNGFAVIDVIDTGPGIPADTLDKIFTAYYSTKRGGTGLGLAMARRIAEEHGGSLTVISELGKGSDFSLRLPRTQVQAPLPQTAQVQSAQTRPPLAPAPQGK